MRLQCTVTLYLVRQVIFLLTYLLTSARIIYISNYHIRQPLAELSSVWCVQSVHRGHDVGDQGREVSRVQAAADDECVPERHGSSHRRRTETTANL